jgi:hypothetical protein
VGGVIPKVMMKASAMDSRNFTGALVLIVGAVVEGHHKPHFGALRQTVRR